MDRRVLVGVLNVGAAGQALAVGLGGVGVDEGRLLHLDHGLVHAIHLLRRADRRGVGVPWHVEGDATTLLQP